MVFKALPSPDFNLEYSVEKNELPKNGWYSRMKDVVGSKDTSLP